MRTVAAIAVCIALGVTYTHSAVADQQQQAGSAAGTQDSATPGDELHFVSVLTLSGEVVAVDPANRLVTLKGPEGKTYTLEARREEDLVALKVGDHVTVRYFEGAQVREERRGEAVPKLSLKDGMIIATLGGPSRKKKHALVASVAAVDAVNQEIMLKGSDGSLETIMVVNPGYLEHVKVGDRVGMTSIQGLGLSFEKEG